MAATAARAARTCSSRPGRLARTDVTAKEVRLMAVDQLIATGVEFELEQLVAFGGNDDVATTGCSGCAACSNEF